MKTREETKFQISIHGFSVQQVIVLQLAKKTDLRNSCKEQNLWKHKWRISSSEKEHKENALALGADEGRDKLR